MTELYLIAHKVRGEPAFDVAHQMEVGDEKWWITTTYGHRAYPYWYKAIYEEGIPSMPEDCPEHFETVAAKGKGSGLDAKALLAKLGLLKPQEPMTRRNW